jgi:CIC family chloride channel protein
VVAGALTGRIVGGTFHALDTSLFTVIGVAAFLGAGYRVPLAGVMFVAEATGRPGFIVPGLLAAVIAQLIMDRASVTAYQQATRTDLSEDRATGPSG